MKRTFATAFKTPFSTTLVCLLLVSIAGCNPVKSMQTRKRTDQLQTVVDTYRKLIRWGYYDQAAQYLKTRDGSPLEADLADLGRFKVTHYSIANRWLADSGDEARVMAQIQFYEVETGVARSLSNEQLWWFDAEAERWYLGSALPNFSGVAN